VRLSLTGIAGVLSLCVALMAVTPSAQSDRAVEVSRNHFNANRAAYGLSDPGSELRLRTARADAQGLSHVRFDQVYRGLSVFEGEAIAHVDADGDVSVTNSLRANLAVDVNPRVNRNAAIATALRFISPLGDYQLRGASLMILPRGERSIVDRLVWHVEIAVENDFEDPAEWQYFVDARTGEVAFAYDGLETTNAIGTANTMYSGTGLPINVDNVNGTIYLRDVFRSSGNITCDMRKQKMNCYYITNTTGIFGNGTVTTSGTTAAADAHFGLQKTWDFYKTTFGRNGIDGNGRSALSRVHYGRNYENAFWNDSCFCMTYGDGASTFNPLVSLDVAGHEMSHGVMSREANLTYSGESGGLNESNSDIFGTLVEFFTASANDAPDYWIGERIMKSNYTNGTYTQARALRYMDDPGRDGASPACWSSGVGALNVHYSSGPNNHMFYLLANGGTSKCNGQAVPGIGNAKAGAIWYKAISDNMTASTSYAGARVAAVNAATSLYGAASAEVDAVKAAYSAINVN
jgi:zinc metalloprotease ZmpA